MNLHKLLEMQKVLDERIVKEKGLEGQDLLQEKILSLQVELGELANEWRGFKFWSEDREPRIEEEVICSACDGTGDQNYENVQEVAESYHIKHEYMDCHYCDSSGVEGIRNPLLEEYVDCLHFILSIGLDCKYENIDYSLERENFEKIGVTFKDKTITNQFNNLFYFISQFEGDQDLDYYINVVMSFVVLGEMLGFFWYQVEQAYMDKNKINHQRQDNSY